MGDRFGSAVGLSGTTLALGARGTNGSSGARVLVEVDDEARFEVRTAGSVGELKMKAPVRRGFFVAGTCTNELPCLQRSQCTGILRGFDQHLSFERF